MFLRRNAQNRTTTPVGSPHKGALVSCHHLHMHACTSVLGPNQTTAQHSSHKPSNCLPCPVSCRFASKKSRLTPPPAAQA